jgi:tetratricopeptide (TPR) repeat protein
MSPYAKKANGGFADAESFGLFMEGLRDLQLYEDEASKSEPDRDKLHDLLDEAVDTLERGHREFPDDLLPAYYLGVALTMVNQRLYAKALADRAKNVEPGTPLGPLPPQPWPLLDRAASVFKFVAESGFAELRGVAEFNLAHVYAKRDAPGDADAAVNILRPMSEPPKAESQSWLHGGLFGVAPSRSDDEAIAYRFQARTLLRALEARGALKSQSAECFDLFWNAHTALISVSDDIARSPDLDAAFKHDLLADSWTKTGVTLYDLAFSRVARDRQQHLVDALSCLQLALQHKRNWIPAQTYLGVVYQARGDHEAALEQFEAVLGKQLRRAPTVTSDAGPAA